MKKLRRYTLRSKTRQTETIEKQQSSNKNISSRYKKATDSKDFDAMLFSFIEEELKSNDKK